MWTKQYNILLKYSRNDFSPTRFLPETATKHLFEIAWNAIRVSNSGQVLHHNIFQQFGSDAALKSRGNLCFFEDVGIEGFFAF
jgi:hypothetical protein